MLENLLGMLLVSPELAGDVIKEQVNKYKPLLYSVLSEGFEAYKDLVNNDDFFAQMAQYKRKMYVSYCNAGFSPEEALMFLVDSDLMKASALKKIGGIKGNVNTVNKQ